jgi:hydroxymethylglutaryl-CoA synthase
VTPALDLAGAGAYVPRLYLPASTYREAWGTGGPRGIDRTAVPDADEDVVTMAAEAATRALDAAGVAPEGVVHLALATTTPPNDEEELPPRLASLLGANPATIRQYGGGTRCGVAAVAATRSATGPALVVVADAPRGSPESDEEAAAGAGAAAVVLTADGSLGVDATGEAAEPAPGTRFRRGGCDETESIGVTQYEREAYRETITAAVEALNGGVEDVDAAALTAPNGRLPYRVAGSLGLDDERIAAGTVVAETGDTGAAGPLLGLASVLDGIEGDGNGDPVSILLVGYGGGAGATAVLLAGDPCPVAAAFDADRELSYPEYLRRRGTITGTEPEGGGAYVSVPSWRRTLPQRHRLVAGRCRACGDLAFPPEGACRGCGALDDYDAIRLPGTGTVEAATAIGQGGAPPEFVEHQQRSGAFGVCVVAFDGPGSGADEDDEGETVSAPAQVVDSPAGTPAVGDRVVAVPRRLYEQEGVVRYGFKIVPASTRR